MALSAPEIETITTDQTVSRHFGEHLTIDGYDGDKTLLNDRSVVEHVLLELPTMLGMHRLTEPAIVQAMDNGVKDPGGWSGFVIIAESHISLHTFPLRGFVSADIYTCKNGLDTAQVEQYFQNTFQLKNLETNFIKRGTRYPGNNIYEA